MPLRLRVISDGNALAPEERLREFAAAGGTIGRHSDNDWVLPDEKRYISSRHAMIEHQSGAYYLVDTSRNGVYVNDADTPVGQGHPQRLFDGDRLRIGAYEIAVDISESGDEEQHDGMRDSIVRAQLVPEEESLELALVSEDKMLGDAGLQKHFTPNSALVQKLKSLPSRPGKQARTPTARTAATAAKPDSDATPATSAADQRALDRFITAAGLDPDAVAGVPAGDLMQTSGKLLRLMVGGLMELLRERSHMKDTFRLPQTVMQAAQNNPLKFSPNIEEAMRYLLNDRNEGSYLSAEDAVKAGFRDVRQHEQALVKAMLQAVEDYVDRFDPDELKARFDKGMKRSGLLAGANKLKYWELYEESYHALTQRDDGGPPQLFSEEFARAYTQEMDVARTARSR
ncbi:MAG: type VI secretion system-associated FHA domain protein TagH [Gammaproteobacteria bacterium]|nr:type VI secretion system-associated FHA domain protein TagH [Gammaproteobacteria bacterium]MCP5139057.1 type VI secretion system-associated FHA domain protein TagH [Chromatiales bacterium]